MRSFLSRTAPRLTARRLAASRSAPPRPASTALALAFLLAFGLTLGAASPAPAAPLPIVSAPLADQYGRPARVSEHEGHVVVAMVVTARRLRLLKSWEVNLTERFPGLRFVRIGDVPSEPPASFDAVARKLRKWVPPQVPVLIDIERTWARAFDLDPAEPNLFLFDREGTLVARYRGRHREQREARLAEKLRELGLQEAPPKP